MNPVRNQKLKIFANLRAGWVSNGMKKLLVSLLFSGLLLVPIVALADNQTACTVRGGNWNASGWFTWGSCSVPVGSTPATYTCPGTTLAPLTVNDPLGADGPAVSQYLSNCSTAGSTGSGPSVQQLTAPPATPSTPTQQTSNPNAFCKQNGRCDYVPLEPLPCQDPSGNCGQTGTNFPAFVSAIFRALITIGGLFAVVMIVVAGIGYMISESAVDIEKAKHRAQAALWGLLLLAGSWLILNTINPKLLEFNLNALEELRTMLPGNNSGPAIYAAPTPVGATGPSLTIPGGSTPEKLQQIENFWKNCQDNLSGSVKSVDAGSGATSFFCIK